MSKEMSRRSFLKTGTAVAAGIAVAPNIIIAGEKTPKKEKKKIHSKKREGGLVVSVFDIIPNNFFNPLSSNSNYRTNAASLFLL